MLLTQFIFKTCRNFFFGSSHGHHKYSKNPPQQTATDSPSTSAEAEPSSSSQSQSPATTSPPTKHNSRLRRSLSMKKLRSSFRRKDHAHVPAASKPHQWQQDEKSVRAGSCNFAVKVCLIHWYFMLLGQIEFVLLCFWFAFVWNVLSAVCFSHDILSSQ